MAKKTRQKSKGPASAGPAAPATVLESPPPPEAKAVRMPGTSRVTTPMKGATGKITPLPPGPSTPRFWFGFEVAWGKLATARVVLFTLLAIDAFQQIGHAPRYGAGGFNVAQLPLLSAIAPGRAGYEVGQLLDGYLLALAALGVGTRIVVPLAAAIYGWLYFGSHLDSYQHHYLMFLVIALSSFVPWQRPEGATASTPIRTWAIRLILCQLAILYFWAAISKLDGAWLDGSTLGKQLVGGGLRRLIDQTIGIKATSVLVILTELALAGTVWLRRTAKFAAPLGIAFHAGIIATKLEIGMFAYLMIGMYTLVMPDDVYVWFAGDDEHPGAIRGALAAVRAKASWILWGLAIAAGIAIAGLVRLENAFVAGIAATMIPLGLGVRALVAGAAPRAPIAVGHVAALLLWLVLDHATDTAKDYYRFWGSNERKFGTPAAAVRAYRRVTEIAPGDGNGHYQLARTLLATNQGEAALPELHAAERLEPNAARAWLAEARYLARSGRVPDAIVAARNGAAADPSSVEARALLNALTRTATPTGAGGPAAPPTLPPAPATPANDPDGP